MPSEWSNEQLTAEEWLEQEDSGFQLEISTRWINLICYSAPLCTSGFRIYAPTTQPVIQFQTSLTRLPLPHCISFPKLKKNQGLQFNSNSTGWCMCGAQFTIVSTKKTSDHNGLKTWLSIYPCLLSVKNFNALIISFYQSSPSFPRKCMCVHTDCSVICLYCCTHISPENKETNETF